MDPTLYTWVRATAADHPHAPALEAGGRVLSYHELLDLADRLAGTLMAQGRLRAVGLVANRSAQTYAGYLAALRCGAVVVPLNPKFPQARNDTMCRLAGVDVVIDDGTEPGKPWDGPIPLDPGEIAYTLFTSGSTGEPKGVPIRHRNVVPYVRHCIDRYQTGPGSRLSQTFDLTFDPSVFDMFVAWCSGGTLVVPQADEVLTPARFVNERRITHWFSVPSVVSIARRLRMLRPGCMPDLKWSLFAGEQLSLSQAEAWAKAAPNSTLENIYGPTELTITCVGHRLPQTAVETSNATVPIGQTYPHLESVLIDENGAATDDGELCVRGSQRFDGYLDPTHNAGRFIRVENGKAVAHQGLPTPDCWYRTGDRVRVEHGELVHLGRLDDQIKISGYRVELGEIESALRGHEAIAEIVVLALTRADGVVELHAVYTGEPAEDLAQRVANLPEYMRPTAYHYRDSLPTNANGKTDRKRLTAELTEPVRV